MKPNTDTIVRGFRAFLNAGWREATALLPEHEVGDWMQANWELLVEANLCDQSKEFLEVYGSGADRFGRSSRILQHEALPTHRVVCVGRNDTVVHDLFSGQNIRPATLWFENFVSWDGEHYDEVPPLDHALLADRREIYLLSIDDVSFELVEIEETGNP